jgi:hypothetical protein
MSSISEKTEKLSLIRLQGVHWSTDHTDTVYTTALITLEHRLLLMFQTYVYRWTSVSQCLRYFSVHYISVVIVPVNHSMSFWWTVYWNYSSLPSIDANNFCYKIQDDTILLKIECMVVNTLKQWCPGYRMSKVTIIFLQPPWAYDIYLTHSLIIQQRHIFQSRKR